MKHAKILALILASIFVLSLIPFSALADEHIYTLVADMGICGPGNTGWGWDGTDTACDFTSVGGGVYTLTRTNVAAKDYGIMIFIDRSDAQWYGEDGLVSGDVQKYALSVSKDGSTVVITLDTNKTGHDCITYSVIDPEDVTTAGEVTTAEETTVADVTTAAETTAEGKEDNPKTSDMVFVVLAVAAVAILGAALVSKKAKSVD